MFQSQQINLLASPIIKIMGWILFVVLLCPSLSAQQNSSAQIFNEIFELPDKPYKVDSLNFLSKELRYKNPKLSKIFADSAFSIAKRLNYNSGMAESFHKQAALERAKGNTYKALELYAQSKQMWDELKNEEQVAKVEHDMGMTHKTRGEYREALDNYLSSTKTFQRLGLKSYEASAQNNIGVVYQALGQIEYAEKAHEVAYNLYNELKSKKGMAQVMFNQGTSLNKMGKFKEALDIYWRVGGIYTALGDNLRKNENHYNLGNTHYYLKNLDSAIYHYFQCVDFFEKTPRSEALAGIYNNLGNAFLEKGNYDAARNYFNSCLEVLEKNDSHPKLEERLMKSLSSLYEKLGDEKKALKYFKQSKKISDSLFQERKVNALNELTIKHGLNSAEQENARLQAEKEKIAAQRNVLVSWMLVLFLIGLSAFLLYFQRVKSLRLLSSKDRELEKQEMLKKLKEQEIVAVNEMVRVQDEERKRIAHELHDEVGSMLTAVQLNFSSIKDKLGEDSMPMYQTASHVLDETYNAIRRIIHEMDEGVLKQFGLIPALEELKAIIENSKKLTLTIEKHGMGERLPGQLEMFLYQITQELVANVIKYAQASEITLQLIRLDGYINLMFEDNGIGFDTDKELAIDGSGGIGIKNIHHRVSQMNGSFDIDSAPNRGTTISINLPIENEKP